MKYKLIWKDSLFSDSENTLIGDGDWLLNQWRVIRDNHPGSVFISFSPIDDAADPSSN